MDGDVFSDTAGYLFNVESIPFFFCPNEWLRPVNPRPAQLNWATLLFDGLCPTAKAIVGFNDDSSQSTLLEVAGSCDSCKPTANNDNIPARSHAHIHVDERDLITAFQ